MVYKLLIKTILGLYLALFLSSCGYLSKKEKTENQVDQTVQIKKKKRDHNLKKRAEEYDGGIIFGKKGIFSGGGGAAQFAAQNPLWRASMQTLDFVPLVTANYSGGILITDWYSNQTSNESIKIQVVFNSAEVKASSFQVKSFKKKCKNNENCKVSNLDNSFNSKIKSEILNTARDLKIEIEEKVQKN